MKKLTVVFILALLSGLYFIGSALGYFFFFEPSGFFKLVSQEQNRMAFLQTIDLSIQHFIIALIAAIPVCLIMLKVNIKHIYLLTVVITLPVAFIGVFGIWNVDGAYNIITIFKDMLIVTLTPLIVIWLLRKFETFRFQS